MRPSIRAIILARLVPAILLGAVLACDSTTAPKTGSLALSINGLPAGVAASVSVTGPNKTLHATASQTFADLDPGTYRITAANASTDKSTFAPANIAATVEVTAGSTPVQASVDYSVTTSIVALTVTGAPAGVAPAVTLTSSTGLTRTINGSGEIGNLPTGSYTVTAPNLDADEIYAASTNPGTVILTPSTTPVPIAVVFAATTGTIRFSHNGLPQGAAPVWDIAGPSGFTRTVSATESTASKLAPGQYVVSARNVALESETYGPSSAPVTVTVGAGQTSTVTMSFVARPPSLNLTVDGAYITQAVQTFGGSVPLVAGRDAFVRIFARANETNAARPSVRLNIYQNGQLISSRSVPSPRTDVPTTVSEQNTNDSWGTAIAGTLMQPGMSFSVEVDPDNTVREVDESDNRFPANGSQIALDVRNVPQMNVRFVPIVTADGITGDVSQSRIAELVNITLRIHPLNAIDADLRAPYNTPLTLVRSDSNNAWSRILNEIEVLRVAEGSGRQYIGVLKDNATTGIAGIAYVGGKSSVSFDANYATETIAHELGHNWGRLHSPCGGPSGVDQQYPYAGGKIGIFGFDLTTSRVVTPDVPDVMSYCWLPIPFSLTTPRRWASDYTYTRVMNNRGTAGDNPSGDAPQQCLIVWGRVTDRGLVLEPAFVATTIPYLPRRAGSLRLQARDVAGGKLPINISFDPLITADGGATEGQFAYAIPLSRIPSQAIASIELAGRGFTPAVRIAPRDLKQADVTMSPGANGSMRLRWDAKNAPMIVVRDPQTREILSLARSGDVTVQLRGINPDVSASNGVRSIPVTLDRRN